MSKPSRLSAKLFSCVAAALLLCGSCLQADSPADDGLDRAMASIRPEAIRAHMRFLSDDLLEGRGTATRGYDIAALYMATQFEKLGLQPGGDNGTFYQSVPLRSGTVDEQKTSLTLIHSGKEEKLTFKEDFLTSVNPGAAESSVEAPVVFVGFGVTAPEQNYDDYKGVDAKGKMVAYLFQAPNFESSLKAHYSSSEVKIANAVAHGAVGVLVLDDPILEELYSFKMQSRDLAFPQLRWLDKSGNPNDYFPEIKGGAFLNMESTAKFLRAAGHTPEEIYAGMKEGKLKSFDTGITARIHNSSKLQDVRSTNIVAKITGSDPVLKNEYVVLSSHLDHVGIGEAVNGDKIYNGALDNASGSAALLEIARAFQTLSPKPKRSILIVSVTGEEAGLLGSDYYAHYPTVPKDSVVANVNMDELWMSWPLADVIPFGAEHSSLMNDVKRAADRMHLKVSPDPMPEEVAFIRSDQYSFVKQGVPAVFPVPGFQTTDSNLKPMEIFKQWEQTTYHQPSDDMNQPGLNFENGATFIRFVFLVAYNVAQDAQRPTWNKGDYFGDHYGKK